MVFPTNAQEVNGGTVRYEETVHYRFNSTGNPEWDAYAKTLPQSHKNVRLLYFNQEVSFYEDDPEFIREGSSQQNSKLDFFLNLGKDPEPSTKKLFFDFKKNRVSKLYEFMTRYFIVEYEIEPIGWKLTNNQKEIAGYICQATTCVKDGINITAWFTTAIPISVGPDEYFGLPGLILAIDEDGKNVLTASSVNLSLPKNEKLKMPNKGRKMTRKKFEELVNEKVKEYNENKKAEETKNSNWEK
jgi:GLPGLI family protein